MMPPTVTSLSGVGRAAAAAPPPLVDNELVARSELPHDEQKPWFAGLSVPQAVQIMAGPRITPVGDNRPDYRPAEVASNYPAGMSLRQAQNSVVRG
jgi:hypothetical protein